MILRMRAVSWLALLLITSEVRSGYYSQCYNVTDTVSGYTLCLSTNTDVRANWSNAQTECVKNGSSLINVTSPNVTNILNSFRGDIGSSLSNAGNWIDVYSPVTLNNLFQWINGAPQASDFDIQGQDTNNPSTLRFAVIRPDNNKQPIYSARQYTESGAYICQFTGTGVCAGGLVRNSSCYMKYNESLPWFDASNSCLQKGGSLAIFADLGKPYNDAKLTSWLNLNETSLSYWIGLISPWWQRYDGGNIQYSNWMNGYAGSPSSPHCVLIENTQNKWTPNDCNSQQRFVCQTYQPLSTQYTTTATFSTQSAIYTFNSTSRTATSITLSVLSTSKLTPTSTAPEGLSTGGAIGIGMATLIVAGLVITTLVYCVKRHHRTADERPAKKLPDIPVSIYDEANDGDYDEIPATADIKYESLSEAIQADPRIYEKIDTSMSPSAQTSIYDKDGYLILTPSHTDDIH